MSEMVERVARAICREFSRSYLGDLPNGALESGWETDLPLARAAIDAMREPTPDMLAAGYEKGPTAAKFISMIDAALK